MSAPAPTQHHCSQSLRIMTDENSLFRKTGPFTFKVPLHSPHSMKRAIEHLFPGRHPQERTPEMSEVLEAIKRRYLDHKYFRTSLSDRAALSRGKLTPNEPNVFPSSVKKPIPSID